LRTLSNARKTWEATTISRSLSELSEGRD